MSKNNNRFTITVSDEMYNAISNHWHKMCFRSQNQAVIDLISRGLSVLEHDLPLYAEDNSQLTSAYLAHPDMQPAVRRLLGLDDAVSSDHAPSASAADAAASLHRDPGDPAFREEIVRYAITQMRELEPDAYNRVFHGAPLEDAIARSLAHNPDDIADSDPPADQKQA